MAYDPDLADRLRLILGEQSPSVGSWTEKAMFGGLAFMLDGHMVLTASRGGMMLRLDPQHAAALVDPPGVDLVVMGGRRQTRWLVVAPEVVADDDALAGWVELALSHARNPD
jgi:TfoX/Sxy family transcriptional regulator of competence genes